MTNKRNSRKRYAACSYAFDVLLVAFVIAVCISVVCCKNSCSNANAHRSTAPIDTSGYVDVRMKNNLDLVTWAESAYENEWGYVYGTWGNELTKELLKNKLSQYPIDAGENEEFIREHWLGRRVTDCVGLIKGYCWYMPETGFVYCSNGMPDIGANRMFEQSPESGEINTIPEIPGLAVWTKGHIGVYIGDGWVIEAMSTVDGIRKTRVSERPWTHWCRIPYIEYL